MIQDKKKKKNDFQVELKATMERIAIQQCQIVLTLVNRSYRSTNLAKEKLQKIYERTKWRERRREGTQREGFEFGTRPDSDGE